jgi:ABC-type multidrug transport system ATPase subunit
MDENLKLTFRNLLYRVNPRLLSGEKGPKVILNGISGEFRGSELSAVIGLSGSGKSSLLDCLSSFRMKNVRGSIEVNDQKINIRKISSYIMQEQTLHEMLTVSETISLSLNLKNRIGLDDDEKKKKLQEILAKLNICDKSDSLVRDLSGGQKKRLSIAVELVHDPKILFLDEPVTNLDHVSATNCIFLLKKLASEGKTVILTIHQPSALILSMFDYIYALANGNCIYQGNGKNIVPFLAELDLVCPSTYNPADFLLEIANNDYGDLNHTLSQHILNGLNDNFRNVQQLTISTKKSDIEKEKEEKSTIFLWQILYLMQRTFLITKRDKTTIHLRLGIHLILGIVFGHIYQNVGNNGASTLNNFKYLMVTVIFQLFMGYYSHVTTCKKLRNLT